MSDTGLGNTEIVLVDKNVKKIVDVFGWKMKPEVESHLLRFLDQTWNSFDEKKKSIVIKLFEMLGAKQSIRDRIQVLCNEIIEDGSIDANDLPAISELVITLTDFFQDELNLPKSVDSDILITVIELVILMLVSSINDTPAELELWKRQLGAIAALLKISIGRKKVNCFCF